MKATLLWALDRRRRWFSSGCTKHQLTKSRTYTLLRCLQLTDCLLSAEIRWLHRSGSVPMSSVSGVEVGIDS